MTETEIALLEHADWLALPAAIEAYCAAEGLVVTLKGNLKAYPGCTHWHLKRPGERGTLEITCWPAGRRLWLPVQDGRRGAWIDAAAARIARKLRVVEQQLRALR